MASRSGSPELRTAVDEVAELLAREAEDLAAATSPVRLARARQHVAHLQRSAQLAVAPRSATVPGSVYAVRDRLMAEAVLHAADEERTGAPVVAVWAHNGHVGMGSSVGGHRTMGRHLREHLAQDYYALGLLLGSGSFRALRTRLPGRRRRLREVRLGPAPPATLEAQLAGVHPDDHVVDLRDDAAPAAVRAWLAARSWTRTFGAVAPVLPRLAFAPIVPGVDYDGLAYVRCGGPSLAR